MKQFEIGKCYGAYDAATPAIKIIKRTKKMCLVEDTLCHKQWRMKVRLSRFSLTHPDDLSEYEEMTDTTVPTSWRECYTYSTRFETEE